MKPKRWWRNLGWRNLVLAGAQLGERLRRSRHFGQQGIPVINRSVLARTKCSISLPKLPCIRLPWPQLEIILGDGAPN